MRIEGALAFVTGAASGIGAATARALAGRGARVVAADIRADALHAAMRSVANVDVRTLDVSDRTSCDVVAGEIAETRGDVDILVNCAGIGLRTHAARTTPDAIGRVFAVNFFGAVHLTYAVLPAMLARRRGSIVNVSSVAGGIPNPREAAYNATKAALTSWTHGLALDLHGTGVHVGVVHPGPTDTGIWSTLAEEPAYRGRLVPPERIARALVQMIERERLHITAPRRYAAVTALYPLLGTPMRWGLRRHASRRPDV